MFETQSISSDDVKAIKAYNTQIDACVTSQTAFNRTMLQASPAAQNLVVSCNGAKVAEEQLEIASKKVTASMKGMELGMKALSIAGNLIIFTAIAKGIQLLCRAYDNLIHYEEKANEKANELFSESSERVRNNREEVKSLDELIAKYKELKSSDNFDIDKRQEVKNIQTGIADLVGTQAKNLDLVNGKLDEEIKKLNEISKSESIRSYRDSQANYYNAKDLSDKAIGKDKVFLTNYDYAGKNELGIKTLLEEYGFYKQSQTGNISLGVTNGGVMGSQLLVSTRELKNVQDKINYLESIVDVLENNGQSSSDFYKGIIEAISNYDAYLRSETSAANSLIDSWITYSQYANEELSKINVDSVDTFEQYRQKMIDAAKSDESIGQILADGTLSNEDLEIAINNYMATATQFSEWYKQWKGEIYNTSTANETPISLADLLNTEDLSDTKKKLIELAKSGELTPDTFTSTKEYMSLLEQTGLTAKQACDEIKKLPDFDMDLSDWQTQLQNARSNVSELKDMLDELTSKDSAGLSSSSVDKIISDYPKLLGYLNDTPRLIEEINNLIADQSDIANDAGSMIIEYSSDAYIQMRDIAQSSLDDITVMQNGQVQSVAEMYGIDLNNYSNLAQAKKSIEFALLGSLNEGWAEHFGVVIDSLSGMAKVTQDLGGFYADSEAQSKLSAYNELITKLNSAKDRFSNNVDYGSAGVGNSSKSGSGSSSKSEKDLWLEEYKKKLAKLQNQLDKGRLMPSPVVIQDV